MQHHQRDGAILIVLSIIGYSFLPVFTKNLLARGVEPFDIAFWRFILTAPVFWIAVLLRGRRSSTKPLPRLRLLLLGTLFAGEALAAFFGLDRLPAGTFVVLFYSYPAMVAILEALLGERLSRRMWIALGLTLVGIVLTAPDFSAGFNGDNLPGVLLALADGFMVAIYFLVTSRLLRGDADSLQASTWAVSGAALLVGTVALAQGVSLPKGDSWFFVIGLALVCTVLPTFGLNAGLQKIGATRAAILGTFEPLLTAILALIFLKEAMLPVQWLGGAVIIASVILLQVRPETEQPVAIGD
jgi:drug/metabolite transporter (DMT)-like permease